MSFRFGIIGGGFIAVEMGHVFSVRGALPPSSPEPRRPEGDDAPVLVTNGDLPCLRGETLAALCGLHFEASNAATMLSGYTPEPAGWGRIRTLLWQSRCGESARERTTASWTSTLS